MPKAFKTSPSQLKGAADPDKGCYRRWGYEYILKRRPEDSGAAAAFGSLVHKELENQWNFKHDPEFNEEWAPAEEVAAVAEAGLPFLPPGDALIEYRGAFEIEGGQHGGIIDAMWVRREVVFVQDWKTTSDLKYALTEEQLGRDGQALTYAKIGLDENPDCSSVTLRWVYLPTKGKKGAHVVETTLDREEVEERLQAVQMEAESLVQLRHTALAHENKGDDMEAWVNKTLDPNLRACFAYGQPCHAIGYCPRPGMRLVRPGEGGSIMGIFSDAAGEAEKRFAGEKKEKEKEEKKEEKEEKEKKVTKKKTTKKASKTTRSDLLVLIDAIPARGMPGVAYLEDILRPLQVQVAEAAGVIHWKTVDYGKGPAFLELALREAWEESKPTGVIVANSFDPGTQAVRTVLVEFADAVVQGVRG